MLVVSTGARLSKELQQWRDEKRSTALVPTMGGLHAGHFSLLDEARKRADRVLVSIFVNPLQFNEKEDFDGYPRPWKRDWRLLADRGVDLVFTPSFECMYPEGQKVPNGIDFLGLDDILEGVVRPGHFSGVAAAVTALLSLTGSDVVLFGEKDYQQLLLARRLARALSRDSGREIGIVGVPTRRAEDGLALSTRNSLLSSRGRKRAALLYAQLLQGARRLAAGDAPESIEQEGRRALEQSPLSCDYFSVRRHEDLALPAAGDEPADWMLLAAVRVENIRLIDNLKVSSL